MEEREYDVRKLAVSLAAVLVVATVSVWLILGYITPPEPLTLTVANAASVDGGKFYAVNFKEAGGYAVFYNCTVTETFTSEYVFEDVAALRLSNGITLKVNTTYVFSFERGESMGYMLPHGAGKEQIPITSIKEASMV